MKKQLRAEARRLRRKGVSVRIIAEMLRISKGTASVWVRDIPLTKGQIEVLKANQRKYGAQNTGAQTNRRIHREARMSYQEEGRLKAREMRPLHLAGCMLYWAEGGKIRQRLYFANSDPNMHLLFIRFLREEMNVSDMRITVTIHCHTNNAEEIKKIEDYWINSLSLKRSNLRKTYTKRGSEIKHSTLKYGVCGIGVNDVRTVQHIYGAIQEYGGFEKPEWLF
jgi:hypothetical protein